MLTIATAFLAAIALLALRLGTEFLPHLEEGSVSVSALPTRGRSNEPSILYA
jgi:Cu/Ag efflux pump CusA